MRRHRTIGIDLAIRGDHVAQIFDDGRPAGRPIRFRHDPASLDSLVARLRDGLVEGDRMQAVMEPTGMSWFPVALPRDKQDENAASIKMGIGVCRVGGGRRA